jgi:cellulose synthase/poly-beta-1,6-N-acetylglucosamine synthase-like glycosyltransferase
MIVIELVLAGTFLLVAAVMLRQVILTIAFWFTKSRPRIEWSDEDAPTVAILIPAHNEDKVIDGCLAAMRRIDYPRDKTNIVVINDRSHDGTGVVSEETPLERGRGRA